MRKACPPKVFAGSRSVKATLLGNHGSALRCLMQYADTDGFTSLGGVGECHHSDGRVIDVSWPPPPIIVRGDGAASIRPPVPTVGIIEACESIMPPSGVAAGA